MVGMIEVTPAFDFAKVVCNASKTKLQILTDIPVSWVCSIDRLNADSQKKKFPRRTMTQRQAEIDADAGSRQHKAQHDAKHQKELNRTSTSDPKTDCISHRCSVQKTRREGKKGKRERDKLHE